MLKQDIYIVIERDEDGYFIGEAPQLKGCYSQGETIEELLDNMREVIELCLEEEEADFTVNEFIGIQKIALE